jgi:membrane protein
MTAHDRPGMGRRIRHGIEAGKQKYSGSSAGVLWRRLNGVDFLNQGMIFAGTLLLCAFPFLIVVDALDGRSTAGGLGQRLGLNRRAAGDVGHLFTSSHATLASVTGVAWVFLALSGFSVGGSLQGLYQRIFGLDSRTTRDMRRALIWLVLLVTRLYVSAWVGPAVHAGGPVVVVVAGLAVFTSFWWFTMWLLLAGRISWRGLPCAVATGVFWVGMEAFFVVAFSGMVTSDDQKYGPIGTVFALMSYLIAIGVVVILGAVTGLVWHEPGLSFRAAVRKLRPNRN